jgi:hypothetical protein
MAREHTAAFRDRTSKGRRQRNVPMVLKGNGKVAPTRSVRPLNLSGIHGEVEIKKDTSLMN